VLQLARHDVERPRVPPDLSFVLVVCKAEMMGSSSGRSVRRMEGIGGEVRGENVDGRGERGRLEQANSRREADDASTDDDDGRLARVHRMQHHGRCRGDRKIDQDGRLLLFSLVNVNE
jgi:hypothetical protein